MANTRELQSRMKSIKDTMKITSAMHMLPLLIYRKRKRIWKRQSRIFIHCKS